MLCRIKYYSVTDDHWSLTSCGRYICIRINRKTIFLSEDFTINPYQNTEIFLLSSQYCEATSTLLILVYLNILNPMTV